VFCAIFIPQSDGGSQGKRTSFMKLEVQELSKIRKKTQSNVLKPALKVYMCFKL